MNEIGNPEQASDEFDKAIELNPNDWMAYRGKGTLHIIILPILSILIDYIQKAVSINRGPELPALLRD